MCQSWKREIIQSNIYRILPKANCMPYIMILAQAVIQILWSQGPLWVECLILKRGIIQSNIHRIFRKVNQVIYITYPKCMPNIMILAQAVLQIFMSQGCFTIQNAKDRILWKVYQVIYIMYPNCMPDIMTLALAVLQIFMSPGCFTI